MKFNNQYRKIYEEFYNTKIPKSFEIHHIDFNHSNNDPHNLVALPKILHTRLHETYNKFNNICELNNYNISDITLYSGKANSKSYFIECLNNYLEILRQCVVFMQNRDFCEMEKNNEC